MLIPVNNNVIRFIFGGNSYFTIVNGNKHFSYNVVRKKTNDGSKVFKLLLICQNKKFYCGYFKVIGNKLKYKHNEKFGVASTHRAITFILETIHNRNKDNEYTIYHEGRCAHCGRPLRDPQSIERGFGPDCWKYIKEF